MSGLHRYVKNPISGVVYPPHHRTSLYLESSELGEVSLVDALSASFKRHADEMAIYCADAVYSYRELDEISTRFASGLLRLGLKPLDRVLFQSANSAELMFSVIGCLKAGLIPVCTLAGHREAEITYIGKHTEARVHIVQGDDAKFDYVNFSHKIKTAIPSLDFTISLRGEARQGAMRFEDIMVAEDIDNASQALNHLNYDPFQVAIFQLSGGTSGVPKVIPRIQNEYLLNAKLGAQKLDFRQDDVIFNPMPMMHNAAMICMWLPTLLMGAAYAIPSDMTPESWGAVFNKAKPTIVGFIRALIPRYEAMINEALAPIDSVRMYWTPDAAKMAREKFNKPAVGMFGMSEGMFMYPPLDAPIEAFDWTVGVPMSSFDEVRLVKREGGGEVAIGEVGEMECRGPYTISGYYKADERNAEAFTADGYYKTGDLLVKREIGGKIYYAFAGRTKDIVNRGHEKVNCEEIETAVSTHPSVSECAVVGMPDPVLDERICAYIVVQRGFDNPTVKVISRHMQHIGMAKFKWPERIEIVKSLPLTKVGKLDKASLRDDIKSKLREEGQEG